MNQRPFAIITTRLPPAMCGIGTYSSRLRQHWPGPGRTVEFLVIDGADAAEPDANGDSVTDFNSDPWQLAAALQRLGLADVLLHYAGRAYHRRGCPVWMPRVLAVWKRRFPGARLMVYFHELPGEMRITSLHYWLGRVNGRIIRQLANLADVVATNTDHHADTLREISRRTDVQLVPVGSNIEPVGHADSDRAATEFMLFGLSFGRLQTLRLFDDYLRRWIASGRLTQLHIIGPADDAFARQADELISRWANPAITLRHGVLASAEVARMLQRAQFAITNVTADTWSKSSALMACAANGCSVIVRSRPSNLVPVSYAIAADELETIARDEVKRRTSALGEWYGQNADWPVIARRFAAAWDSPETP